MHKKLLVISIDSMINEDLELMTAFPAFRELLEQSLHRPRNDGDLPHSDPLCPHQYADRLLSRTPRCHSQ